MGIPSYFAHVVRNYADVIRKLDSKLKVHNLYLDSNSIIYDALHRLSSEENSQIEINIIKKVCEKIEEYIKIIKPVGRVIIAFDGVAPVAKMEQQRTRRYKSWYQENILSNIDGTVKSNWNRSAITPGTEFMNKLDREVKKYFSKKSRLSNYKLDKLIVTTSTEPGEGEHKIYKYIRDNKDYHYKTNTVIYGLDADLIMLTLNHLDIAPNMYLYRETPEFIKTIDNNLEANKNYLIDIPLFGKYLNIEFNGNLGNNLNKKHLVNRIKDYVFICFLLGNDFLPHFPAINIRSKGIEHLINAYKKVCIKDEFSLIDKNNVLVWKNIRELFKVLAANEHNNICQEYNIRRKMEKTPYRNLDNKSNSPTTEDKLMSIPIRKRQVEEFINPYENGWRERYYIKLFDTRINIEREKEICINYLEGLEWTWKYYSGDCIDWRWSYKYYYPPLLNDLIKYIPYFDTSLFKKAINNFGPVSPYVQLSYVLPRASLDLLPPKLFEKLLSSHSDLYEGNHEFVWAFCRYFWEAHIKLPHIDIKNMDDFVTKNLSTFVL